MIIHSQKMPRLQIETVLPAKGCHPIEKFPSPVSSWVPDNEGHTKLANHWWSSQTNKTEIVNWMPQRTPQQKVPHGRCTGRAPSASGAAMATRPLFNGPPSMGAAAPHTADRSKLRHWTSLWSSWNVTIKQKPKTHNTMSKQKPFSHCMSYWSEQISTAQLKCPS